MGAGSRWLRRLRSWAGPGLVLAAVSGSTAACGAGPDARTGRSVLGRLDIASAVRRFDVPAAAGLQPTLLRVSPAGVWLADAWANRVGLFTPDGRAVFVIGGTGAGPAEFKSIRDIRPLGDGRLAVLDPVGGRISVLGRDGVLQLTVPLSEVGHAEQLVPVGDTAFVLVRVRADTPLVRIDLAGRATAYPSLGWPEYARLHPLAAQLTAATDGRGRWVLGMLTGTRFVRFRGQEVLGPPSEFIEPVQPPEVVTQGAAGRMTAQVRLVHRAAQRMALADGTILVLFGGATEEAGRLLDLYDFDTGRYLGTRLFEEAPADLDVLDGLLYALYAEREPPQVVAFPFARS